VRFAASAIEVESLDDRHDRTAFHCGREALDRYFRQQATQDIRRGLARVFVAVTMARPEMVLGYYTLNAASISPSDLPREAARRLPGYPVPAALIGRLAVDLSVSRQGLGGVLLADAIGRAERAAIMVAMFAVVVDPIDENAQSFYAAFGFHSLQGPQKRMFLTLARQKR
jgi:GNAT superfamily N-acetyltransferase